MKFFLFFCLLVMQFNVIGQTTQPYLQISYEDFNKANANHFKKVFSKIKGLRQVSLLSSPIIGQDSTIIILIMCANNPHSKLPLDGSLDTFLESYSNSTNPSDTGVILLSRLVYSGGIQYLKLVKTFVKRYRDSVDMFMNYPLNGLVDKSKYSFFVKRGGVNKGDVLNIHFSQNCIYLNGGRGSNASIDDDPDLLFNTAGSTQQEIADTGAHLLFTAKYITEAMKKGSIKTPFTEGMEVIEKSQKIDKLTDSSFSVSCKIRLRDSVKILHIVFLNKNLGFHTAFITNEDNVLQSDKASQPQIQSLLLNVKRKGEGNYFKFLSDKNLIFTISGMDFKAGIKNTQGFFFKNNFLLSLK
ncbi:MAG: hypothetical protein QM726_04195 [Chitinophagaceae bacterium]